MRLKSHELTYGGMSFALSLFSCIGYVVAVNHFSSLHAVNLTPAHSQFLVGRISMFPQETPLIVVIFASAPKAGKRSDPLLDYGTGQ